ncbi:MAG: hypothetical protein PHO27_10300, partial [Sulfuricurvum sp.]|nr:hypothetical protein [Sulfuricurvum sp.]
MTEHVKVLVQAAKIEMVGDKGSVYQIKSSAVNKLSVHMGEKYHIVKKVGDEEQVLDNVIAVNNEGNLELQYSDGTRIMLDNFYQTQNVEINLPANDNGIHTISSLSMGQESSLVYMHGDNVSLLNMTEGNHSLQAAVIERSSISSLPHYAEVATGIASDAMAAGAGSGAGAAGAGAAGTGGGIFAGMSNGMMLGLGALGVGATAAIISGGGKGDTPPIPDTTAPTTPTVAVVSGAANATAAEATAGAVTVSAENGSSLAVTFTNGIHSVTKTVTATGSAQTIALASGDLTTLGDGTISVSAIATDAATNHSTAGTGSFVLDTLPPVAPTMTFTVNPSNSTVLTDTLVSVSGVESGAVWQYSTDGGAHWTTGTGNTFLLANNTAYNAGDVRVKQTDVAGNSGVESSNTISYTNVVDTTAPTTPTVAVVSGAANATAAEATAGAVTVSAENGSSLAVTFTNG